MSLRTWVFAAYMLYPVPRRTRFDNQNLPQNLRPPPRNLLIEICGGPDRNLYFGQERGPLARHRTAQPSPSGSCVAALLRPQEDALLRERGVEGAARRPRREQCRERGGLSSKPMRRRAGAQEDVRRGGRGDADGRKATLRTLTVTILGP